jgi:hypothetical protein
MTEDNIKEQIEIHQKCLNLTLTTEPVIKKKFASTDVFI